MNFQCLVTSLVKHPSSRWVGTHIFLFVALFGPHASLAQEALNELTVDRPGFADTPFTVPKGSYQFELGFDYHNRYNGKLYYLPNGLFRTGISKRTELRIGAKNLVDKTDANSFDEISPVSIGFKTHIIKQNRHFPEMDIAANMVIPAGHSPNQTKKLGYEFLLLFQNDFYPNSALNYNIGFVWDAYRGQPVYTASVCFNYLPTLKVGLFVEYFGFVINSWPGEHGLDGGFTYLVAPHVQIDLSAGISRQEGQFNLFVSSGLTYRIN